MRTLFVDKNFDNILAYILSLLNVKYTNRYANKHFNEHPNKYDMFGLSKMLNHYGVHNVGIKVTDKENEIQSLEPPFTHI